MTDNTIGYNITYNELGFAFNPISVRIDGVKGLGAITLTSNGYQIKREPLYDYLYFDLSGIARSLFDRTEFYKVEEYDTTLYKALEFTLTFPDAQTYSGSLNVVWGALQMGETFKQERVYTCFLGYPFTVPFFLDETVSLEVDGKKYKELKPGKYNININDLPSFGSLSFGHYVDVYIFDKTFDITFRPQKEFVDTISNIKVNVKQSECNKGDTYLRWINRHGEYNYYLFKSSTNTITTKDNSISYDNTYTTTDFVNNYNAGLGQAIGKDSTQTIRLVATLVDSDTYDFLTEMVGSPVIDQFMGYDDNNNANWLSVTVKAASFAKKTKYNQDFEFDLIPNAKITQQL